MSAARTGRRDMETPRSRTSLGYLIAAMVLDTFVSLAALLYAINLWVDGQPDEPRSPTWWNPFRHVHLVSGPIHPWAASGLLVACAGVGVMASRRAITAPRIAAWELVAGAVLAYAPTYFTPQPLVLWGVPMSLAYLAAAALVLLADRTV